MLFVKNIFKSYGKPILRDISFTLKERETLGVIGVSGVGKSTLFNIIAGLQLPDSGNVVLGDVDVTGVAGCVGYMTQKDFLLPYYSVLDNVCLPLTILGVKKATARAIATPLFSDFLLGDVERLRPKALSLGMRQRAALLRTYLFIAKNELLRGRATFKRGDNILENGTCARKVMLLDEPFSALDALTKSKMHSWYGDMADKLSLSTIIVTHDIEEAAALCDRVIILKKDGENGAGIFNIIEVANCDDAKSEILKALS